MVTYILYFLLLYNPQVEEARGEFRAKIKDNITCNITFTNSIKTQTKVDIKAKSIYIKSAYWVKLDPTAKRVTILRELLHCELEIPYLSGVSIMNRRITQAVNAYKYGAE